MDPAEERRLPEIDREQEHLVEREENRNLDRDRQTAGDRVDLLALEQGHLLLLLLHLVVGIKLLKLFDLRLQRLHLRHRHVGLVGERKERELHQHRHDQDRDAEIADEVVDRLEQPEHRAGQEIEPAPVDHQAELLDARIDLVAFENPVHFRAGEHEGLRVGAGAGRDGLGLGEGIGLEEAGRRARDGQRTFEWHILVGRDDRAPICVGEAEPAADAFEAAPGAGLLADLVVGEFLDAAVADETDEALVQHRVAGGVRRAMPRHQRIGIERDRIAGLVGDGIVDREQEVVVDCDGPREHKSLPVVPGQGDGLLAREFRPGGGLPERIVARQDGGLSGRADEADLGIIGLRRAGRRQQDDVRALRIDRLTEIAQGHVVDAAALQRDRAKQASRLQRHARALLERLVAAGKGLRGCGSGPAVGVGRAQRNVGGRARRGIYRILRGGLLLGDALRLALLLHLRRADEILPADEHEDRQTDRQQEVLGVFFHRPCRVVSSVRRRAPRRVTASSPSASVTRRSSNGRVRSICRPTIT